MKPFNWTEPLVNGRKWIPPCTDCCCLLLLFFFCVSVSVKAATPDWWQGVHNYDGVSDWSSYMTYASAYFGPNALPVPELPDGSVSLSHRAEVSANVFWGFGDQTQSLSTQFTYVFIPGRLAISGSGVFVEHYKTTTAVRDIRASLVESAEETVWIGDYYLSTQVALLRESGWMPDASLSIILKTASSETSAGARFFDTPGYMFDFAVGKTISSRSAFLDSCRVAANVGFLCYQLNSRRQNDAPLYGALCRLYHGRFSLEAGMGGYEGWINGSRPLVFRSKLSWMMRSNELFIGYQHAFRDYPFRRIQAGFAVNF